MNDSDPVMIRIAVAADAEDIARMVRALAAGNGESHKVRSQAGDFARHGFGEAPAFQALIAERGDEALGLSLWFCNFSSWRGDIGIYLQDLYVDDSQRGTGLGRRLLIETARRGRDSGASHLRLSVSNSNSGARTFYERLGLEYRDDECIYQISDRAFGALADNG